MDEISFFFFFNEVVPQRGKLCGLGVCVSSARTLPGRAPPAPAAILIQALETNSHADLL